jgi:hypothetical protein
MLHVFPIRKLSSIANLTFHLQQHLRLSNFHFPPRKQEPLDINSTGSREETNLDQKRNILHSRPLGFARETKQLYSKKGKPRTENQPVPFGTRRKEKATRKMRQLKFPARWALPGALCLAGLAQEAGKY